MKYYDLEPLEKKLLEAVENDEFVKAKKEKQLHSDLIAAAKQAGLKTKNINLRLSERLILKLKAQAAREGIPYQTLAASILHKNVL